MNTLKNALFGLGVLAALATLLVLAQGGGAAPADDCEKFLQPSFDWSKKGTGVKIYPLFVTLTIHDASQSADKAIDTVYIAQGNVGYHEAKGSASLVGTLNARINKGMEFPAAPQLTFKVSISNKGMVSVQEMLNGKPFAGRPPVEFQANCQGGLLTAIKGSKSYVLSFTRQPAYDKI